MQKKTVIYTGPEALAHDTGNGHPESAARLRTLQALFEETPFKTFPRGRYAPATEAQVLRAHTYAYLQSLRAAVPDEGVTALDGDTLLSPTSLEAALAAAGAACAAVDAVVRGDAARAFCAMRPPGHHAEPDRAMGFCLLNSVFIAARHAQETYGLEKIAIVDFDVHHGNGTDTMTRSHDGSILYASTHQYPLWPMSGHEDDNDECVTNLFLPPASGSKTFRDSYSKTIFPILEKFSPDLLLISAGFDAHRDDPLAQIELDSDDFAWVTQGLCAIADKSGLGRVVSVLEGGYDLRALRESTSAHLAALAGIAEPCL